MTNTLIVKYETDNGVVQLSPEIVRRYLVSGDSSKVTDQEIMMFIKLCEYQKLNPFLREAYLIKFGNEPATLVTGKETFTKRAAKSKLCNGYEAGVVVQKKDGSIEYRKGTLVAPNETLIGGWAKVYRKDWNTPLETSVSLSEYERRTKDGKLMSNWAKMPATMIRKVALVQALREALPEEFQGLYSPEEMPVDDSKLPQKPVEINAEYEVKDEPEVKMITTEQKKKIWELAQSKGMNADELKLFLLSTIGKESSKEMTFVEAETVLKELEQYHKEEEIELKDEGILFEG
ncbi:phage recombination protein Bet [Caloramator sp. CAR-1]|uniref:phage recombination protein Bet n=1 Tax=Caloramator sp. CAR-1 TaxID=3062777 RepID=UPI0026E1AAEA|nr:phage recombination protein Bet [Caloramator sp. CAR-1]MDO6353557.1 phage recombination protein Bet [Caloramator sp. CAR-1]